MVGPVTQSAVASPPRAWCLFNTMWDGTHWFHSPSTVPVRLAFAPPASLVLFFRPSCCNHLTTVLSPPQAMAMWSRFTARWNELDALVEAGLLYPFTEEGQVGCYGRRRRTVPHRCLATSSPSSPSMSVAWGTRAVTSFEAHCSLTRWSSTTSTRTACSRSPRSWSCVKDILECSLA